MVPACLKAISYKVIELFGDMYVFLETNCGSTLLFKVIQYFKPPENVKEMIQGIIASYGVWFDFEGVLFPSPYKIGLIWVATFRKCIGCSTREQCAACIWAGINTIVTCFPTLLPPKIVWGLTNVWVRIAFEKSKGLELIHREEKLRKILLGVYGQF